MQEPVPQFVYTILAAFAFVFGAVVGSFLNVVIYRLPLGLSVNEPKRSFCPSCKRQIPWYENIPLFSWLALRGKCANCKSAISIRYFGVELLTGLMFLAIWQRGPWEFALPYWIFVSLLIAATFIDFEHFIIPDEITLGGTAAGVVCSLIVPGLVEAETWWQGGLWSLIGAASGYGMLWAVVELGKKAFGRKRVTLDGVQPLEWKLLGEDGEFRIGEEKLLWSEMFFRPTDRFLLQCPTAVLDGKSYQDQEIVVQGTAVRVAGDEYDLEKVQEFRGTVREIVIPREAMGFGDVKFIACIGAFLGWKAVVFTVVSASMIGAVVGSAAILARRREWSAKIPFGPYLALGALLWMFVGPAVVAWYLGLLQPPEI